MKKRAIKVLLLQFKKEYVDLKVFIDNNVSKSEQQVLEKWTRYCDLRRTIDFLEKELG